MSLVIDCVGGGLAGFDLELIRYLITAFKECYPLSLNYIIVLEMPWILNGRTDPTRNCLVLKLNRCPVALLGLFREPGYFTMMGLFMFLWLHFKATYKLKSTASARIILTMFSS